MFNAIKKATETDLSFAALSNALVKPPTQVDSQESFWLAETLKYDPSHLHQNVPGTNPTDRYFYLIFSEPELISLDDYVL